MKVPVSWKGSRRALLVVPLLAGLGVAVVWIVRHAPPQARGPSADAGAGDAAIAAFRGAKVTPRANPRTQVHAYGRAGDLVLSGSERTALTVAATADEPGHRPLQGALVDVDVDGAEGADPLLWLKVGWRDGGGKVHLPDVADVETMACGADSEGLTVQAVSDGVTLRTEVCALEGGRYRLKTLAAGLDPDASIVDELHPGTALPTIEGQGFDWDGEHPTRYVTFAEHGVAFAYEANAATRAIRNRVRIATEVFPTAIHVVHANGAAVRTLSLARGDALDAVGLLRASTRSFAVGFEDGAAGTVTVVDGAGRALASGAVPAGGSRALRLPPGFGEACEIRDEAGVLAGGRVSIPPDDGGGTARVARGGGALALAFVDADARPLAVHVLVRGLDGTPEPRFEHAARVLGEGASLYLLDGRADLRLAPGRYSVVASHGPAYSILRDVVTVEEGAERRVAGALREVVDTSAWVAGDFHLHAAPSPDSTVTLEARLATLVSEGIDLAVATDHNRVVDYGPTARRMGLTQVETIVGDEITSGGARLWGHFNAFPLPVPGAGRAPEDVAIPYFDTPPAEVFAHARDAGAQIVQLNHPRMPPRIGYFDLAHLDPRTGVADAEFSDDFDAVEAFNGIWLEDPPRVREGARDLVALARRGKRVAAMGNSDSHKLHFEEAGYPRTYVHTPREPAATRARRAIEAILAGDTVATSGPLLEVTAQGRPVGSTVTPAAGKVRLHVRVSAAAWVPVERVEIWVNDAVAQRFAVAAPARDGLRFEKTVEVPVDDDATILVWVEAETPLPDVLPYPNARAIAFTSPFYVDADGDGRVRVPPAP